MGRASSTPRPVEIVRRSDPAFVVQATRWIVERAVAWITIKPRLAKDFERFAATVLTTIQISVIKLMSRRARTPPNLSRRALRRGGLRLSP